MSAPETGTARNPWVGLKPFARSDSELFFGRERETRILSNLVATLPAVTVYAPSGTGKSSLLNAGLAPQLTADESQKLISVRDPRADIAGYVRNALIGPDCEIPYGLGLAEMIRAYWDATDRRVIVVIDQFEERLNADTDSDALYRAIAGMVHAGSDAGCFVLSIREDYLGSLEPLMRRVPGLMDCSYRVPQLERAALERAIYGPAARVDADATIEPSLVSLVLDDLSSGLSVLQEPGEQRFEPGYFQIVWSKLWEKAAHDHTRRLTVAKYRELGGAGTILKDFTSAVLDELEPARAEVFWAMCRYLVLPTGAKTALTVDDLTRLLRPTDFLSSKPYLFNISPSGGVWLANVGADRLEHLVREVLARLTTSEAPLFQRVIRSGREEFELLHDLLGTILLNWRREFEALATQRMKQRHQDLKDRAERIIKNHPVPSSESANFASEVRFTLDDLAAEAMTLSASLEGLDDAATVQAAHKLMAYMSAASSVSRITQTYDLGERWAPLQQQVPAQLFTLAFDHPSSVVRRDLQEWLPFIADGAREVSVPIPRSFSAEAIKAIGGLALGFTSFAPAYLLTRALSGGLGISYVWLTLLCVCTPGALLYLVLVASSSPIEGFRPLAQALAPVLDKRNRHLAPGVRRESRLLQVFSLAFTWPLPAVWVTLFSVGAAAIGHALGWHATPWFNVGALIAAPVVGIGLAFAVEL